MTLSPIFWFQEDLIEFTCKNYIKKHKNTMQNTFKA